MRKARLASHWSWISLLCCSYN